MKKIRFYHLWDFDSIISASPIVALFIVFWCCYFYYPTISQKIKQSNYDGNTNGKIISIKEEIILRQTHFGNKPKIDHFTISFCYTINNELYSNTEYVDANLNSIDLLQSAIAKDSIITVLYKQSKPTTSSIQLSN